MSWLRKGQSTLEYVIILAVVIGAIIVVVNKVMKPKLQRSFIRIENKIQQSLQ